MNQFENYRIANVSRKSIKEHPLNPRSITPQARTRLRAIIRKHGVIGPVAIVNERTGFMLGGHQRVSILDDEHGNKDYDLQVIFVDKSEAEEKEIIVSLNNQSAQGQWDEYALLGILQDEEVDKEILGFSETERMHFDRLLKEQDDADTESAKWLGSQAETYDAVRAHMENDSEQREAQTQRRETKKQAWERTVEELMPPPPPRDNARTEKDESFRSTRENWKNQAIDANAFVRIVFKNTATKAMWLQANGMAGDLETLHEGEIPDQSWRSREA